MWISLVPYFLLQCGCFLRVFFGDDSFACCNYEISSERKVLSDDKTLSTVNGFVHEANVGTGKGEGWFEEEQRVISLPSVII